jgi:hypothetical protein
MSLYLGLIVPNDSVRSDPFFSWSFLPYTHVNTLIFNPQKPLRRSPCYFSFLCAVCLPASAPLASKCYDKGDFICFLFVLYILHFGPLFSLSTSYSLA